MLGGLILWGLGLTLKVARLTACEIAGCQPSWTHGAAVGVLDRPVCIRCGRPS